MGVVYLFKKEKPMNENDLAVQIIAEAIQKAIEHNQMPKCDYEGIVKGINGKTYCRSKVTMNWWSAHAWCEAAQGFDKLINPTEDCDCTGVEGCDTTLSCPNLATDTATVWTNMVASSVYVYCLRMYSGSIERCHKQGVNSGGLLYALCK